MERDGCGVVLVLIIDNMKSSSLPEGNCESQTWIENHPARVVTIPINPFAGSPSPSMPHVFPITMYPLVTASSGPGTGFVSKKISNAPSVLVLLIQLML